MNRRSFLLTGTAGLATFESWFGSPVERFPLQANDDENEIFRSALEPAYIKNDPEQRWRWLIGNGLVERVVRFSDHQGLYTESWRHKLTGTDFLMRPASLPQQNREGRRAAEFVFQADGARLTGAAHGPSSDFTLIDARIKSLEPKGKLLEVRLRAAKKPVDVSVFYAVYPGHPVIRKWISITNHGRKTLRLSHLAFEVLALQVALPAGQSLFAYYGVHPREIFYTGRAEDAAIVTLNPQTREGLVVMNEAPGWTKRTQMVNWGDGVSVMYDTDLFPFEKSLAAGETFTTAKAGIACFVYGRGMADPRWSMSAYTSNVLMKKGAAYSPPWVFNTWEPFFQNYNEEIVNQLIPIAAEMGFDIFTLDTGWSENYAENEVNRLKFPHGLKPIQQNLETRSMRLGLWEPLAVVSSESSVYREHPEWTIRQLDGQERTARFPGPSDRVMCLASPYREAAAQRIIELIGTHHLAYVKIDLTTVFNAYGEAPGCYARGHDHANWAESLNGIYEGIQYVCNRIYHEHPDVLLDLTFELWGQKHIIDYGLLDSGDLDWMSNVDDSSAESAGPRQARTLLYHRSMAIPVETMLIGNLRATTPAIEERFATTIGSAPLLLGDLRQLLPEQVKWYAEKIRWFKTLRREIALNESFFPLGDWLQPTPVSWDGFARLSRQGEGIIVLFKNETDLTSASVQIPTYPPGEYQMKSVMTENSVGRFSGAQLRRGVSLPLPKQFKVQILEVRRS